MNRKDYEAIAAELNVSFPCTDYGALDMTVERVNQRIGFQTAVNAITRVLAEDNERFDIARFHSAVYNG